MNRALMLDVDGVLLSDARRWTADLEADLGVSPAALRAQFFEKHWHKIVVGAAEIEPLLALALEQMGADVQVEAFLDYWFSHDAVIVEDVLKAVTALRAEGWAVYLATNQEHRRAAYLMGGLGLAGHVDGMLYSAVLGARKPDRDFFSEAGRRTGLPAEAHLLVDDTLANVKAARKAGWQAHHWEAGQNLLKVAEVAARSM